MRPRTAAPRSTTAPDKARLFGDPTLVPTREGERARLELAAAGEIAAAITAIDAVQELHVDVEIEDDGAQVIVAGRRTRADDDLDATVAAIADAVLAAHGPVQLTLALAEFSTTAAAPDQPHDVTPPRSRTAALALAAMGLGASLAVFLDRLWWRRRRTSRRSRTRA